MQINFTMLTCKSFPSNLHKRGFIYNGENTLTIRCVSKLLADYPSFQDVPAIIANCSIGIVDTNLYSSLSDGISYWF